MLNMKITVKSLFLKIFAKSCKVCKISIGGAYIALFESKLFNHFNCHF